MLRNGKKTKTRYVVVTGGVLSGVGKGTGTASLAKLLKEQGFKINVIKIDPYINVDAGTMRPTEHGEVFVTYDGGETDQDIGNYERFLDTEFSKLNNITTGRVYLNVIQRERNLEYGGECVSVIPHIPDEVKRLISESSKKHDADFTFIEVGGTTGDHENVLFLEAFREMKLEGEEIAFVHVVYLPVPGNLGEMKTKPAQHSVRELNAIGIIPDFVLGRGPSPLDDIRKQKLANFSNLNPKNIISAPDVASIYDIPLNFEKEGLTKMLLQKFGLGFKENSMTAWKKQSDHIKLLKKNGPFVTIGIVGKYFDTGDFVLEDSYMSVIESIKHACYAENVFPNIQWINAKKYETDIDALQELSSMNAIIVPGGFGASGVEGKLKAITYCREHEIPYLGLCYGLQLAVVEFARNICGFEDANSTETNPETKHPIIDILPEQRELLKQKKYGASMRLGNYEAELTSGSLVAELYGSERAIERHRHRYEVNPEFHDILKRNGLIISGTSQDGKLVEYIELKDHPFFVATQSHPEFTSHFGNPNPLFVGLIQASKKK